MPSHIIHDRTLEFLSNVLQAAAMYGLQHQPTSGGYPQTDGLVNRLNWALKSLLTKLVPKKGSDWDTKLGPVLMVYRTTLNMNRRVTIVPIAWLKCQGAIY